MKDKTSYYEDQLKKVFSVKSEFPRVIKITNDDISTNWLSLNDESATELVKFLKGNYNVDETNT